MSRDIALAHLREQIDAVDGQLLQNISRRSELAKEVARIKSEDPDCSSFYRPEREALVLRKIIADNPGPMPDEEMARIFREIMSACLALEQQLNIAFLGPAGTFTQSAALKHFGHSVQTTPIATIGDVFSEVESGECDFGIVPVENSIEGVVNHTLDNFMNSRLKICGEVELRIHHYLLSQCGSLDEIKEVYAHQQALAQCRRWLSQHLPEATTVPVNSNAEAARRVSKMTAAAAIAGESAAELYDLKALARNIEDEAENTTRFLIIGHHLTPMSGDDKTSILFATVDKPGALYPVLRVFFDHEISMMRIESRPSRRGTWDYSFFVDIEAHIDDPQVSQAFKDLEQEALFVKLLGSYPRAVL